MAFILILCHCIVVLFELCIDNNQIQIFFFFFFLPATRSLLMACLSEKHIFKLVWPYSIVFILVSVLLYCTCIIYQCHLITRWEVSKFVATPLINLRSYAYNIILSFRRPMRLLLGRKPSFKFYCWQQLAQYPA